MLTEAERQKLRAEEIYREEVRRDLSEPSSRRDRVWALLNSSIFIWFLSSVVVALVAAAHTRCSEASKTRALVETQTRRLNVELARRAAELQYELDRVAAVAPDEKDYRFRETLETIRSPRHPIFEEFESRSLSSVLWERSQLDSKQHRGPCIEAFTEATRIEEIGQTNSAPIDIPKELGFAHSLLANLRKCVS